MSTTVIDELITLIGVDIKSGTQPTVEKFSSFLGGVMKNTEFASVALIGFAGAMAGAVAAVFDFTMHQSKTAGDIQKLHDIYGINTKDFQEMQYAAEAAGTSAESLEAALSHLVQTESNPMPENFNRTLVRMGISVRDNAGKLKEAVPLYMEIADKIRNLNPTEQLGWLNALGISKDNLLLMKSTRAEIAAWRGEATIISKKDLERARAFNRELGKLQRKITTLKTQVGIELLPFNEELVKDLPAALGKFWDKIVMVNDALVKLRAPFDDILPKMKNADIIVNGLAIGMGALAIATIAATWQWLLMAAAILGAISAYEKWKNSQPAKPKTQDEIDAEWAKNHPKIAKIEKKVEKALGWDKMTPEEFVTGGNSFKEFKDNIVKFSGWDKMTPWEFITGIKGFKGFDFGKGNTAENRPTATSENSPVFLNKKEEEAWDKANPMNFFSDLLGLKKVQEDDSKNQKQEKGNYFKGYGLEGEAPHITIPIPMAPAPIPLSYNAPQQKGNTIINNHIEQHIQGGDSRIIADESARKIQSLLQTLAPGGYVEVFS